MNTTTLRTLGLILLSYLMSVPANLSAQSLYELHWASASDPTFSGSGGATLTQALDSACSYLELSVTDPVNSPLGSFNPLIINPQLPAGGGDLTDLSGNMSFHLRVRSRDTVTLGLLLRAGDGSSAFRTSRISQEVPGDSTQWTELTFTFDAGTIGGFDSTDLRDIWFYLDPGTDNFAGNQFFVDYFSIGSTPDSAENSTCPGASNPGTGDSTFYGIHWTSINNPTFGGSGGAALTQTLDSSCSYLSLVVTDPVNAPLPSFSPLSLNPQLPAGGGDLVDLSGNMSFHVRVQSQEAVSLGFLLRSGDGSSAFRTSRIAQTVPGDTTSWTELTYTFDATTIGGFDSTDLRDIWFYLDAGTDNFAGDEFVFDYFYIGTPPDSSTFSTCLTDSTPDPEPTAGIQYALHYDSSADPLFSGSSAATLNQLLDTACSQLFIEVADTATNPWGGTSPIIINPRDSAGNDIADLSNSMAFHLRVRSRDTVDLALRLRAGDGSTAFRTNRISQTVPGDTTSWTELTYVFDANDLAGFDSTDLRDIWLHLDYGTDNFSGNAFWIDYFAIGPKPEPSTHSGCSLIPPFEFPWTLHWADTLDPITSGSGAEQLTQMVDTACSQLMISVTEPILFPHPAFRPIILNPQDEAGNEIADLSGQLKIYTRVRSLETVEFSMILRGGSGAAEERSERIEYIVPGGLEEWTELVFDFSGANLGAFDSTDLRDIFMYLDRETPNFVGNEFYLDYVSIGSPPDAADNSTCVDSAMVSIREGEISVSSIYPNPAQSGQPLQVETQVSQATHLTFTLMDLSGKSLFTQTQSVERGKRPYQLPIPRLTAGMYILQVKGEGHSETHKIIFE